MPSKIEEKLNSESNDQPSDLDNPIPPGSPENPPSLDANEGKDSSPDELPPLAAEMSAAWMKKIDYSGKTIGERYKIDETLGEGGMGTVYRAKHVLMDKTVAVKVINKELANIPEIAKRFEREAKSASRLTDPHCINVTDFGRTPDGTLFLVMEFLEGETLSERLEQNGSLSVEKAIQICKHILKALVHAHGAGVVHRDLKPDNVMLVDHGDETDFAKVFDFGIAQLASGNECAEHLTRAGVLLGTPAYLAPERALGMKTDHRSDIYSVGIMLFEMLAGFRPFKGKSAVDIVSAHVGLPIPALPKSCEASADLKTVLKKSLAKKPDYRFSSALEFYHALEEIDPLAENERKARFDFERLLYFFQHNIALVVQRRLRRFPTNIRKRLEQMDAANLSDLTQPVTSRLAKMKPRRRRVLVVTIVLSFVLLVSGLAATRWWSGELSMKMPSELGIIPKTENDDNDISGLLEQANIQLSSGLPKEATVTARKALRLSPRQPVAHLLLGHALFLRGDRLGATKSYHRSLRLDKTLADDKRLGEYLEEGLKYAESRENAAAIFAEFFGKRGIKILASRANTALSTGAERAVARQALIAKNEEGTIDWVTSLTADFNEYKSCSKRREIIAQMEKTKDVRFLPILKAEIDRPVAAKPKSRSPFRRFKKSSGGNRESRCSRIDVRRAYRTLRALEQGSLDSQK